MTTQAEEGAASPQSVPTPPPLGRRDLASCALIAGLIAAAFWPLVTFQRALYHFDITELGLPFRHFYGEAIARGAFPLWTDAIYCGYPIFAEGQAGALYPLNLLLFPWLPSWAAFNLSTVGHLLALCLSGYLFFRTLAGPEGAAVGALALGHNAFVTQRLIHTCPLHQMAWAPLLFWIVDHAFRSGRFRWLLAGSAVVAVQVLAGQQQFAMMTALGLAPWVFFRAWRAFADLPRRKRVGRATAALVVIYGLGASLAGVQIIPSLELLYDSTRASGIPAEEIISGSWPPGLAPTLLFPDVFGSRMLGTQWLDRHIPIHEMGGFVGVVTSLLALFGAARSPGRRGTFFVAMALAGLAGALGSYSFFWPILSRLPVLESFRVPARMLFLTVFAVCALAARGVDALGAGCPRDARSRTLRVFWLCVAGAVAMVFAAYGAAFFVETGAGGGGLRSLTRAEAIRDIALRLCLLALATCAILFLPARLSKRSSAISWALVGLVSLDALLWTAGRLPTVSPSYWSHPPPLAMALQRVQGNERFWNGGLRPEIRDLYKEPGWALNQFDYSQALQSVPDNTAVMFGLRSASGQMAVRTRRFNLFWTSKAPWKAAVTVPKYHLADREWSPQIGSLVASVHTDRGTINLYEKRFSSPRAWLVHRVRAAANASAATAALPLVADPLREAVVECSPTEAASLREPANAEPERVFITHATPESVTLSVCAAAPALVVLADTWYPGWRASVDGQPAKVLPADVLFRGVFVGPGEHEVRMVFKPASFRWGVAASLCALAALAAMWVRPPSRWAAQADMPPFHRWRAWRGWLACGFAVVVALSAAINGDLWLRSAFPAYTDPRAQRGSTLGPTPVP